MSLLYLRSRPMVAFDPTNANHRKWFAEFIKYRGWGRCPVRFMAESLEIDLVTFIEHKMLAYYVQQEFKNANKRKVKPKPRTKTTPGVVRKRHTVSAQSSSTKKQVSTQP